MRITRQAVLLTLILLLNVLVLSAQQPASQDYPTVDALTQAVIPLADPVILAQHFRGVGTIMATPASAPLRQVGDHETFWANNSTDKADFQVATTLRAVGDHIYIWVEDGVEINPQAAQALADAFDQSVYDAVRQLWGEEPVPGIDGDPHVYGVFVRGLGGGVAAYFLSRNLYSKQVFPSSNEHEMFFYNLNSGVAANIDSPSVLSNISHEFQHMIRDSVQRNEAIWLNEGFSTFTQLYLFNDYGSIYSFLGQPQTQLNTWAEDVNERSGHYGAATLFVDYFFERYGLDALHTLSLDPGTGLDAFEHVLKQMGQPGVNEFFADWALANFLLKLGEGNPLYGYRNVTAVSSPTPLAVVTDYPFTREQTSNQYATDYYVLTHLQDKTSLDVHMTVPDTVQLLPTTPASGQWMWYSNKNDNSDMTLTHAFDLTEVENATLHYKTWYHLEDLWDYGYVSASEDGGQTWQILQAPGMTAANPVSTAYGAGYSGQSENWLEESIPLDAYAGKQILLRFEVITDDAITQPGLALDDIRIPEIGYSSDFEVDGGGWETGGWVRTDNRLPQQMWVQAAQQIGERVELSRWLAPAESHWTLALAPGVDQVLLVISPFAPVTTVPTGYSLEVAAS